MGETLVLGLDAGGTGSRALVASLDGRPLARSSGASANPTTLGVPAALASLRDTLAKALAGHDPASVAALVLGLAGQRSLRGRDDELGEMLGSLGLHCPVRLFGDAEIAFASATAAPDGRLLIAGTGSIAVRLRDREVVDTTGGHGWLLGDEGSGFWLGREAVRLAVETLRGHAGSGELTRRVLAEFGLPADAEGDDLLAAVYDRPPLELARLAPLLDDAAVRERGATELVKLVHDLGPLNAEEPVVLTGSCLRPEVLGTRVTTALHALGAGSVLRAHDAAAGAAWLAACELLPPEQAVARHGSFCG
jgi:N-acetylglucosamine kinase-like BadF-type ATPase